MMKWKEKYRTVVVSTAHLPEEVATRMTNGWNYYAVYEKTDYGFRLWTKSDSLHWPAEIRPLMMAACMGGFRWVEFDCDAAEQEGFETWEW